MENFKNYLKEELKTTLLSEWDGNLEFVKTIHRELLKGIPVSKETYYSITDPSNTALSREKASVILDRFGEVDEKGDIIAFFGLSLIPTNHQFITNGLTLYTWCVVDAILFADWLKVNVNIISCDPADHTPIELQIERDHLQWTKPHSLYVSWVKTMDACNIRSSLCNHVSFFGSDSTANQWLKDHPGGQILTIDTFFESGKIELGCC